MNSYKTLNGQIFRLDQLNALDHSIYAEMKSYYDSNIQWTLFTNLWINRIKIAFKDRPPSSVVEEPIYQICQDLDSRLAIRQGCAREPDYRDLLADIIDIHFKSRYKFCKELGIDEGYLSSVLNRKRHFSLKILQEILDRINYRIVFMEKVTEHPSEQKSAIKEAEGSTKPYEPTQHMMNVNEIDDMGKFHKVKPKYFYEMGEYRFLSVDTPQDLEKVLRLRYQVYCVELELKPQNSQGLEQDEYDQYAVHFLAMDRQDKIVATLRIIPRSPTGSQFKSDSELTLHMIINDIQKAIEIGRFALSKDVPRQDRGAVAFGLFKCIFDYCNNNEIRDLFAVTLKYTIEKFESSNYPTFKLEPVGKPFELPGTSKQWVYVHFQIPSSQENYAEGSRVVLEAISHAI